MESLRTIFAKSNNIYDYSWKILKTGIPTEEVRKAIKSEYSGIRPLFIEQAYSLGNLEERIIEFIKPEQGDLKGLLAHIRLKKSNNDLPEGFNIHHILYRYFSEYFLELTQAYERDVLTVNAPWNLVVMPIADHEQLHKDWNNNILPKFSESHQYLPFIVPEGGYFFAYRGLTQQNPETTNNEKSKMCI